MSAGTNAGTKEPQPTRDTSLLAPKFCDAVTAGITEFNALGHDAMIYETYRSLELAQLYYARGRTIIPPHATVTNAHDNLHSWHGFGLAVDIISRAHGWDMPEQWFRDMATVMKRHGCKWGGDWKQADLPHVQWGACKPSPSDHARALIKSGGMHAVWVAVGAI